MSGWSPEQWTTLIGTLGIPAFLLVTLVFALYRLGRLCLPPMVEATVRHIDRVTSSVATLESSVQQMSDSSACIANGVQKMLSIQSRQDRSLSELRQIIVGGEQKRVDAIEQIEHAVSRQAEAAQKQSEALANIATTVEQHLHDVRAQLAEIKK